MQSGQIVALVLFAVATSFTPGPNNAIAAATGARFGMQAALPHVLGVPFGMCTLLLAGAAGTATLLLSHPAAMLALHWLGFGYLMYIAWLIARTRSLKERAVDKPLTFVQSALFQYANPKAWMMAVGAVGSYLDPHGGGGTIWLVCAVFAACGLASVSLWSWLGATLRHWLARGSRLAWFNRAMGGLLAATAVWMLLD